MKKFKEVIDTLPGQIFVIVKPGFLDKAGIILERIKAAGFELVRSTSTQLSMNAAKRLYYIHKDEDWYYPLCKYMSSGISTAFLFEDKNPVLGDRFKRMEKLKDSIREEYGESDMRNVMHSSDSEEHMNTEYKVYFSPESVFGDPFQNV